MKKFFALLVVFTMIFASVGVSAKVPEFMLESQLNYTADYTVSFDFEGGENIAALFAELEMPEEVSAFVDISTLLNGLLSMDAVMHFESSISEDYTRMEAAITADTIQTVDVNKNLNVSANSKMGMWIKMDVNANELVVIYSMPVMNKYLKLDIASVMDEEASTEMFDAMRKTLNKDTIDKINQETVSIMCKYADINLKPTKCTMKYTNKAFVDMLEELIPSIFSMTEDMNPYEADVDMSFDMPSLEGLELLGDKGLTYTYYISGKKINRCEVEADIKANAANIYTVATGEPWEYNSKGKLDSRIKADMIISDYGKTKPTFPVLTEENSFDFEEYMNSLEEDIYYEEYEDYVYPYAWSYADHFVYEEGRYYIPLRYTLEDAFGDKAAIDYNDGKVTVNLSDPGLGTYIEFNVGSNIVHIDGAPYDIGTVKIVDASVYVSTDFFTDVLNWELIYMQHDILSDALECEFYFGDEPYYDEW